MENPTCVDEGMSALQLTQFRGNWE